MNTMTIIVENLKVHARIGVLPQERTVGNEFKVTLMIEYAVDSSATDGDELHGTLNYAELIELIKDVMSTPSMLLEHVVAQIVERIRSRWSYVTGGTVKLLKVTPPIACEVDGVGVSYKW